MSKNLPLAIVGMSFRLPQGMDNNEVFWQALLNKQCLITEVPENRWETKTLQHNVRNEQGRSVTFKAGILNDIDKFDAQFFSISPREAALLDPQQRLLLTMAYETFEDANIPSQTIAGSDCGVYVGISGLDYGMSIIDDLSAMTAYSMTGNTMSIAANRISYVFDLHGPSFAVDTACSSSLVALHNACEAIRNKEVPMALVGGINILMHPYAFVGFSKASMISATGESLPFDAKAKGYVRGEGGAVLLIKPLEDAIENNDKIHAIIQNTGINVDGRRKTGITIPSIDGQTELMQKVLDKSGLSSNDFDFIEMHATGTEVGDPIEAKAVSNVYGKNREKPLLLSTVKGTTGHLESGSGMASMVKMILALKNRALPPIPYTLEPNPHIDFENLNLKYVTEYTPLNSENKTITAAINSFGFGGANAHAILQSADAAFDFIKKESSSKNETKKDDEENTQVNPPLFLSAPTKEALDGLSLKYAKKLKEISEKDYYDFAFSAFTYRNRFEKNIALLPSNLSQMAEELENSANNKASSALVKEEAVLDSSEEMKLAFVYSGNGAQWHGMARNMLELSEEFTKHIKELDELMLPEVNFSILDFIKNGTKEELDKASIAQPLLFAIQVAITRMLGAKNIKPNAVLGHSVGEIVAAWSAGILDLQQAIHLVAVRSQCQHMTVGLGKMAAAKLSAEKATSLLEEMSLNEFVCIAGVNAPQQVTLSGSFEHMQEIEKYCASHHIYFKFLDLDYAFHSPCVDGILPQLKSMLSGLKPSASKKVSFISTVYGKEIDGKILDVDYWIDNVRKPVFFANGINYLLENDYKIFIEISPNAILQRYVKDCAKQLKKNICILPTLTKSNETPQSIEETALHICLASNFKTVENYFPHAGKKVNLPTYAWQSERYWVEYSSEKPWKKDKVHALLGWQIDTTEMTWENVLDPAMMSILVDHKVGDAIVFPMAGYAEIALAAASEWKKDSNFAVENLSVLSPLVFDNCAQTVRTSINTNDGTVRIFARQRLSNDPWNLQAIAYIVADSKNVENLTKAKIESLSDTSVDNSTNCLNYSVDELYAEAKSIGLEYGKIFQGIKALSIKDNVLEADVTIDDNSENSYILHPAVLDSCFHSLIALINNGAQAKSFALAHKTMAYLPVKIGKIGIYSHAEITQIRVKIIRISSRTLTANCELLDKSGHLVASASSCRFKSAPLVHQAKNKELSWHLEPVLQPYKREKSIEFADTKSLLSTACDSSLNSQNFIDRRVKWYNESLPLIEALTLSSLVEVSHKLYTTNLENFANLQSTPYGKWIFDLLAQEEILTIENENYTFNNLDTLPTSKEIWQTLLFNAPESLGHLLKVGRISLSFEDYLGKEEKLEQLKDLVLTSSLVKNLNASDPLYLGINLTIASLLTEITEKLPQENCLEILYFSNTPHFMMHILSKLLPQDRFKLTILCENEDTISNALSLYADNLNISAHEFNSRDWKANNKVLENNSFDLVIVDQMLYKTKLLSYALDSINNTLFEDALLVLSERYADWSANYIEGLDDSYWGEQKQPSLKSPETWEKILLEKSFKDITIYKENEAKNLHEGAFLVLAKSSIQAEDIQQENEKNSSYLLLADKETEELAKTLSLQLSDKKHTCSISCDEEPFLASDSTYDNFIYLRALTKDINSAMNDLSADLADLTKCALAVNEKSQALENKIHFWIFTHGASLCDIAHSVHSSSKELQKRAINPAQASFAGLARVIMNELSDTKCSLVEISTLGAEQLSANILSSKIAKELEHTDFTDEVILTENERYASMLAYGKESNIKAENCENYTLDIIPAGTLNNLKWYEKDREKLDDDDVEVQTMATGLNFRDIMLSLDLLPDDVFENGFAGPTLGLEFSGIVSRVGASVTSVKAGDKVVGFGKSSYSKFVTTKEYALAIMPNHWSFDNAASVPTVFFTTYYSLIHLAQMQKDETILIHGAAGGVGLSAIQIAKYLGVKIYATAGSNEKRDLLRLMGVEHIYDSRSLDFVDQIKKDTDGKGVDVVLNSLAGDFMRRSISLLKPFGRFLELGKRDFVENTTLGLAPLKDNISYFAIDADQMLVARPELSSKIFKDLMKLFHENILSPLPVRTFTADQIIEAYRSMQQAQHIGKIVITFDEEPSQIVPKNLKSNKKNWNSEGTWLVVGGLEGFGLESAKWLVSQGVKSLVLSSRRGMEYNKAPEILEEFKALGVEISIEACDVTNEKDVHELIEKIQAKYALNRELQLKGILHAAAIYDDRLLGQMNQESYDKVLNPKLIGAWNLHKASVDVEGVELNHFILYSSISVALGNVGQANYVAANAGQEALALLRKDIGLPATCVAFGPIGDVGYLVKHSKVKSSLENYLGAPVLSSKEALDELGKVLSEGKTLSIITNVDWAQVKNNLPYTASRYRNLFASIKTSQNDLSTVDLVQKFASMSESEVFDTICEMLTIELGTILSLDTKHINRTQSLQSLGLDSLMAVELALALEKTFSVRLPAILFQGSPTIETIASKLVEKLTGTTHDQALDDDTALKEILETHGESISESEQIKISEKIKS